MKQERGGSQRSVGPQWLADGQHPLDWNGPTGRSFIPFRDDGLDRPIISQFERVARRHPKRIAVSDSDTSLSYAELWDGVSGLAETIAADTRPGDPIAIVLPTCSMFPLAMLACLAAGRPFVALDPYYPGNWLGQVLQDARPAMIIGREDVLGGIETVAPTARVLRLIGAPRAASKGWRPAALGVDEPACVVFTSGSTGRPKGIVNSQRTLLQRAAQSINAAHINADDRFLTLASLCTIVGVRDAMTALVAGASVHLLDPQRAGAREMLNVIRAEGITILFAFPALLRSVVPYGGERAHQALRLVRVGGDTTLWGDIDLLRGWLQPETAIQVIYAATEAPMMQWFVDDACRTDDLSAEALAKADPRLPIGYPLPGNRLALIDEHGGHTPPGEVGELIVGSPYVALGQWVDGRCAAGSRLFRSGDLVRQRPDGLLERIGRKDRQVKIRGTRVDLDGVEAALRRHPLVRDVGALARDGVTLVAYVSARDAAHAGLLDDLKDVMRSVPPPMRPGRLYLVHTIPRLPSSKLDLRALLALDEVKVEHERATATAAAESGLAGDDAIARTVARVWHEVLQTPVGGPEDDFFDAGGDSLKAITFTIALEQALGLELSSTLVTEAPTFAGLCEALSAGTPQRRSFVKAHRGTRSVSLVPLKPGDGVPPVFIIPGLGGNVAGFLPMSRRMTYRGAVIGIQARGLDGHEAPHATVEAMAAEYLRAVKARQPEGPYYLCGYSFGGLVAFEVARRLRESGDEVALVGLFDTTMSPLRWPLRSWLSVAGRRMVQFAAGERLRDSLRSRPTRVLKVVAGALIASARYRPGLYPGELTLFTPVEREPGLPSLQAIWRRHARTLSIVETAGAHSTMFSATHAESTAASLTRCLLVASLHHS